LVTGDVDYLQYFKDNGWSLTQIIDLRAIYDLSLDPSTLKSIFTTQDNTVYGKTYPASAHAAMDIWYDTYIAPLIDYDLEWRLYMCFANPADKPLGGIDPDGLYMWNTPATDAEADEQGWNVDDHKNTGGNITGYSFDSLYGPGLRYLETNYSTNFRGWACEFAYTNELRWLTGASKFYVTDSVGGGTMAGGYNPRANNAYAYPWNTLTTPPGQPPAGGSLSGTNPDGSTITPTPDSDYRLNQIDEVQFECYTSTMFQQIMPLEAYAATNFPSIPVIQNFDTLYNINSDGTEHATGKTWWMYQSVGEPNNRHYWEWLAESQDMNLLRELRVANGLRGAFDGISCMQTGSCWPWAPDAQTAEWWLDRTDRLGLTVPADITDISVPFLFTEATNPAINIAVSNQTHQNLLYLTIRDANGSVSDFSEATVTWEVLGTSITKTTADSTIFRVHPSIVRAIYDPTPPTFVILLTPDDLAQLSGTVQHQLTVTHRDLTSSIPTDVRAQTYSGTLTLESVIDTCFMEDMTITERLVQTVPTTRLSATTKALVERAPSTIPGRQRLVTLIPITERAPEMITVLPCGKRGKQT
jgi:hypothetical protein